MMGMVWAGLIHAMEALAISVEYQTKNRGKKECVYCSAIYIKIVED
jgi:hypothetical protein